VNNYSLYTQISLCSLTIILTVFTCFTCFYLRIIALGCQGLWKQLYNADQKYVCISTYKPDTSAKS